MRGRASSTVAVLAVLLATPAIAGCFEDEADTAPFARDSGRPMVLRGGGYDIRVPGSVHEVCYDIYGVGEAIHHEIHTSSAPHPDEAPIRQYAGPSFGGDFPAQALPIHACYNVPLNTIGTLYLRGHAHLRVGGAAGNDFTEIFSDEITVEVRHVEPRVRLDALPERPAAGAAQQACWSVEGSGTAAATYLLVSQTHTGASLRKNEPYPGTRQYPDAAPENTTTDLPARLCVNLRIPPREPFYVRAVAEVFSQAGIYTIRTYYASPEVLVTPLRTGPDIQSVTLGPTPPRAPAHEPLLVCWTLEGTGTIPYTALHTGKTTRGYALSNYDGPIYYPDNATAPTPTTLPATRCTNVPMGPPGDILHITALARADAEDTGVLSDERRVFT